MARPRQVSDDEILAAARACFLENGPGVATSAIADELGISQAAIFKRFGTKRELMLQALMPPEVPEWTTTLAGGPDDRPIVEQLLDITRAASAFFECMSPMVGVLKASGIDMSELFTRYDVPPPVRGWNALSAWLKAAQDTGRLGPGNPETIAMMMIGSLHGRAFMTHVLGLSTGGPVHVDRYAEDLVETLWRGLAPSPVEEP